jgi:predicted O-methyltransferase YrrM
MNKALQYAKQICFSSEETLLFTYAQAQSYKKTDGVFVECGVAAGAQIIAMAAGAPDKTIYAFDSFQGIPLPSNKDDQYPGIRKIGLDEQRSLPNPGSQLLESTGATVYTLEQFWNNVDKSGVEKKNIITIQGWFEETVPVWANIIPQISILRLDGDLYNSTIVCLEHLYPLLIPGGILIIDDWDLPGCRQAIFDYFGWSAAKNIQYVSNIAYMIK